jgi:hypothetical protein
MTTTASVTEVRGAGVTIDAEEAVAIAQQLMAALRSGANANAVERPHGPPAPENVYLDEHGSVFCRASETTPAVSELAIFLQAMLPGGSVHIPGGLRYAIARALLDVDVPPFDSLEDFSETLTRYERGSRQRIVRRVLQRLDARRSLVPVYAGERRRHPHATPLRRALRDADARLYLQKVASEAATVTVITPPARPHGVRGAVASIAAGLLLIVTGEFIDGWHRPALPPPRAATPPARVVARDVALVPAEPRTRNAELRTLNPEPRTLNPEVRRPRPSAKRVSRIGQARPARDRARKAAASERSVLDRLRLNWLRTVFTSS